MDIMEYERLNEELASFCGAFQNYLDKYNELPELDSYPFGKHMKQLAKNYLFQLCNRLKIARVDGDDEHVKHLSILIAEVYETHWIK
jgi:hypothetical protein